MSTRSIGARDPRLSWSILLACAMAAVGVIRLFSDFLTDIDPTWVSSLGDSPLRYMARTTDGSLAGNLNVQYFKVLAIPCGLAVVFLLNTTRNWNTIIAIAKVLGNGAPQGPSKMMRLTRTT